MNFKQRIIELINKYERPTCIQRSYFGRQTFLEDFSATFT